MRDGRQSREAAQRGQIASATEVVVMRASMRLVRRGRGKKRSNTSRYVGAGSGTVMCEGALSIGVS